MDRNRENLVIPARDAKTFGNANTLDAPTFKFRDPSDLSKGLLFYKTLWPELISTHYRFDGKELTWQPGF
jgi:hypothetical protein